MATKTYRVPVAFGEAGTGKRKRKKNIVLVLERVRNVTGLSRASEQECLSDKKSKNGEPRRLRGHKDNAIKVWLGGKTRKGHKKYLSIPYPAGATIRQIAAFVKKIRGAKTFTMPSGQTYSVGR
jgi:hypothetical protein